MECDLFVIECDIFVNLYFKPGQCIYLARQRVSQVLPSPSFVKSLPQLSQVGFIFTAHRRWCWLKRSLNQIIKWETTLRWWFMNLLSWLGKKIHSSGVWKWLFVVNSDGIQLRPWLAELNPDTCTFVLWGSSRGSKYSENWSPLRWR